MAIFQFGNRTLPYSIEFSPAPFDLLLLQSSKMSELYWVDVLNELRSLTPSGGRVVTVGWNEKPMDGGELSEEEKARDVAQFVTSLGLVDLHVMAVDDATQLVEWMQTHKAGVIRKTLLLPQSNPKSAELIREVRKLLDLS